MRMALRHPSFLGLPLWESTVLPRRCLLSQAAYSTPHKHEKPSPSFGSSSNAAPLRRISKLRVFALHLLSRHQRENLALLHGRPSLSHTHIHARSLLPPRSPPPFPPLSLSLPLLLSRRDLLTKPERGSHQKTRGDISLCTTWLLL